ncbi:MAG: hypothetical protein ACFNKE_06965, partial [Neisseria elongata]
QRYAHRCRGLAPYRHRQQQHAGAMGVEGEDMVRMTVLTIMAEMREAIEQGKFADWQAQFHENRAKGAD